MITDKNNKTQAKLTTTTTRREKIPPGKSHSRPIFACKLLDMKHRPKIILTEKNRLAKALASRLLRS
jgi:hypothetical protein